MKSNFKKLPGSVVELEVSLDREEFQRHWDQAYREALEKVHIKGFRPGTAPEELARQAVHQERVFEAATEEAVKESIAEVREEHEWAFVDTPQIEIIEAAPKGVKTGDGLKYKARLILFPAVELGDYKKIAKRVLAERQEPIVEEPEIEKALDWLRQSRATETRVTRGALKGDLAEADIESSAEGKPIDGGALKSDRFIVGESRFVPGFDDKLFGHSEGEKFEFTLTAPLDYWNENLRGKEIQFKVKLNGVFERILPELDDDFAKRLGSKFENIADLKESIRSGFLAEKREKEKERIRAKMLQEITKASTIDPPAVMTEKTLDAMVAEVHKLVPKQKSVVPNEDIRRELAPRAKEQVLANLVIYKIIDAEHLIPLKEEVTAEAERRNLDPEKYYDYTYGIVQHKKLFEFLESNRE